MKKAKKISIVVSVYNEEAVLGKFLKAFDKMKATITWDYEVIFVNDGSCDNSLEILQNAAQKEPYIKIISFSRNFGHEAAMIAGIDYAVGDGVICMDADLQHPLQYIPKIIDKFEDDYDIVNMIRMSNKSAGVIKNITSGMFYKIVNKLSSETSFEENASVFFALSKKAANVLKNNYRERNRFLRGYVQSLGFRVAKLEYEAPERAGGQSHYSIGKLMKFSIDTIICFSDFPLKLGIYAGVAAAVLGLVVLIYTLLTYRSAPSGYATIVILICFLFAVMFVIIGIIGEYVAILFSEVKGRPIYIVDKKINFEIEE